MKIMLTVFVTFNLYSIVSNDIDRIILVIIKIKIKRRLVVLK